MNESYLSIISCYNAYPVYIITNDKDSVEKLIQKSSELNLKGVLYYNLSDDIICKCSLGTVVGEIQEEEIENFDISQTATQPQQQQISAESQLFVCGKFEFYTPKWHLLADLVSRMGRILSNEIVIGFSSIGLKWLIKNTSDNNFECKLIDDSTVERENLKQLIKATKKYETNNIEGEWLGSSGTLVLDILYNEISPDNHFVMDDDFEGKNMSFDFGGYFLEEAILQGDCFVDLFKHINSKLTNLRQYSSLVNEQEKKNREFTGVWVTRIPNY